jgi:hypothetical protein
MQESAGAVGCSGTLPLCPIHPQASDPVVAGTLPHAGAFGNLEAKDRCCIESRLIYEQKNAMLGLQVVPHYDATLQQATCCCNCLGAACCCCCLISTTELPPAKKVEQWQLLCWCMWCSLWLKIAAASQAMAGNAVLVESPQEPP